MNIKKIDIKPTQIISYLRQNVNVSLIVGLVIVLLLSLFTFRKSVSFIIGTKQIDVTPQARLTRVNFDLYDRVLERFNQAVSREPKSVTARSPFGQKDFKDEE